MKPKNVVRVAMVASARTLVGNDMTDAYKKTAKMFDRADLREIVRQACWKAAIACSHSIGGAAACEKQRMGDVWPMIISGPKSASIGQIEVFPIGRDGDETKGTPHYIRIVRNYGNRVWLKNDVLKTVVTSKCVTGTYSIAGRYGEGLAAIISDAIAALMEQP